MADKVDINDVISVLNRLDFLANKSRVGTPGIGPDKGKEFKGGLTSEEMDESNRLSAIVEQLLKASRPVYGIKNPDGTTTLSYTNPTAKEEAAYRLQYGANTSLAAAGNEMSGGKVLTWAQKQEAMKRVEELRPQILAGTLPYSTQQEFSAIQRNLYASILVNKDNPNPPEANASSIFDNAPALLQQSNWGPADGVQVGAAPGSMPGATPAGPVKTLVNQTRDSKGSIINKYSDGSTITVAKDNTVTSTAATTGNRAMTIEDFNSLSNPDMNATAADEMYNSLKGRAVSGIKNTPEEQNFINQYLKNKATNIRNLESKGTTLTAAQIAEKNFLSGQGYFDETPTGPTTNIQILKAALRGLGFTSTIIESSTAFLNGLIKDGLDIDNATEIFLNSKEYTLKSGSKITSPFYTEYGYLNEGLTVPKSSSELFNAVEGFKGVVDKYKLSNKYLTQDNLRLYVKNDVTVADLAERAAMAQLRAIESDPFQVDALVKQGFIASSANLNDFFMDSKIGKEQLELNRQTGVFTAEALRRAKSGISTSADQLSGFKQLTATLAAKGYNEAQISQLAGQGFENIAGEIQPLTSLSQIYDKAGGTVASNLALTEDIQKSLLQEEFMGTASERRKRLSEQNIRAFQGTSGTTSGSLRTSGTAGIL
jgi:hypothetical protein